MESLTVAPLDPPGHGLRLIGALDLSTVSLLEEALQRVAEGGQVTLDLSELTFVDSTGLHALVRYARSQDGNGPVILDNPSAMVLRLLEITHLKDHPGLEFRS